MPKGKTHEYICRMVLGKSYPMVDKVLDLPVVFLGRNHRKLFHSIPEAVILGLILTGHLNGSIAAVLHTTTDSVDSYAKRKIKRLTKNGGEEKIGRKEKKK